MNWAAARVGRKWRRWCTRNLGLGPSLKAGPAFAKAGPRVVVSFTEWRKSQSRLQVEVAGCVSAQRLSRQGRCQRVTRKRRGH